MTPTQDHTHTTTRTPADAVKAWVLSGRDDVAAWNAAYDLLHPRPVVDGGAA